MANELSAEQMARINTEIKNGKTISAIKLYREFSGENLTESKKFIDELTASLREAFPEQFASLPQNNKGCMVLITFVLLPFLFL